MAIGRPAPGVRTAHPHRTVRQRAATPNQRAGRSLPDTSPRPRRDPLGRGVGTRSHGGPRRDHRGRHPNGPADDTHRPPERGSRWAALGGGAAADSGIPAAARPVAPGAGGRRAAGHERRIPRRSVLTLHQPSGRQMRALFRFPKTPSAPPRGATGRTGCGRSVSTVWLPSTSRRKPCSPGSVAPVHRRMLLCVRGAAVRRVWPRPVWPTRATPTLRPPSPGPRTFRT